MLAVWMLLRAQLRARWRPWLALALVFGMAGGAATAAVAGARRTDTAYPRFVEAYDAYHVIPGGIGSSDDPRELARIQRAIGALPQVERAAMSAFVTDRIVTPDGEEIVFPEVFVAGDVTGAELVTVNRARVLSGRMFDAQATDEAVVDAIAAGRLGIEAGDRVTIMLFDPETFESTIPREVLVAGVVITPGGLPAVGQVSLSGLQVSPGFIKANARFVAPNEDAMSVRLYDESLIDEFIAAARAIAPTLDIPVTLPRHVAGVRKTLRFDVAGLWILAVLIALSAVIILGQALAREVALEAQDRPVVRALGLSRGQSIRADLLRSTGIGLIGGLASMLVAIAASPLTPRGLARLVEPTPGIYADWTVLALGGVATLGTAIAVSVVPSLRAARREPRTSTRPSRLASMLTGAGAGPSAVAGARLALEPGHGPRAVPVRATIGGVAVALAAFVAAGTFTESLDALIARPELYGFAWDVFGGSDDTAGDARFLASDPDLAVAAPGGYSNIVIEGRQLIPLTFEPGSIEPAILEGSVPRASDEIALGSGLLRELDLAIGDEVMVANSGGDQGQRRELPFTVVGRTVVPPVFFQQVEPGESSAITLGGAFRLQPSERAGEGELPHLIRYRAGTDIRAKVRELREKRPGFFVGQVREPGAELTALSRSSGLPVLLTVVLLGMALATLVHTLGSSIRKRGRDLAILKTLGFLRRQVRATVAWQSSALVAFGLVIGIPLGIAGGSWAWRVFAGTLGVVPDPVSPVMVTALIVPAVTVIVANVIAALPARAAARTKPALVLRSE